MATLLDMAELQSVFPDAQTGVLSGSQLASFFSSEITHPSTFITEIWLKKTANVK